MNYNFNNYNQNSAASFTNLNPTNTSTTTTSNTKTMRPNYSNYSTLVGHTKAISSVKFSPDGNWLASACKSKIKILFNPFINSCFLLTSC